MMARFGRGEAKPKKRRRDASPRLQKSSFNAEVRAVCQSTVYGHVFENKDREVGGVLIGWKSVIGSLPRIDAAIEAISADEQRATLTFTQESWEHVHRVMEDKYPDSEIVGWYHSHPGFGIFLSEHDLFIHNNFFGDLSQVALVVDPIAGTEGVFTWQDGKVKVFYEQRTADGWAVLPLSELERQPAPSQNRDSHDYRTYPLLPLLIALAVGLFGGALAWGVFDGDDQPSAPPPVTQDMETK